MSVFALSICTLKVDPCLAFVQSKVSLKKRGKMSCEHVDDAKEKKQKCEVFVNVREGSSH